MLTVREMDVLLLIAHGHATKEIASILGLSPTTVSTHRKHICSKLRTHSTAELIPYALLLAAGEGGPDGPVLPIAGHLTVEGTT